MRVSQQPSEREFGVGMGKVGACGRATGQEIFSCFGSGLLGASAAQEFFAASVNRANCSS